MSTATRAKPSKHAGSHANGRRPHARRRRHRPPGGAVLWAAGAIIVALAVVAIVLAPSGKHSGVSATGTVTISGAALPDYSQTGTDAARGLVIPEITGKDFTGHPVQIKPGTPTLVMFLAHWCPHCQKEVPLVQSWLASKGSPPGWTLVSVSTGVNAAAGNYPPQDWLAREHWSVPVIADDAQSSAGRAFGVTSYPAFVFVGADGTVKMRTSGELPLATVESSLARFR